MKVTVVTTLNAEYATEVLGVYANIDVAKASVPTSWAPYDGGFVGALDEYTSVYVDEYEVKS